MTGTPNKARATVRRRTPRLGRMLGVAVVALVIILAGYATYGLWSDRLNGPSTIIVYTYGSLLGGCAGSVLDGLLAQFDAAHGANVEVECLTGTLVSTLLQQKDAPRADVVVGLDEVTAPQAEANGLLIPYASPQLAHVNTSLTADLGPGDEVTPYEWGYLSIDYNESFLTATHGAVAHAGFANFSDNASWANQLMIEDPTLDLTGEEFLLWEIAYEQYVAHANWQDWWQAVDSHVRVSPDWSDAFLAFQSPPNNPMMVVSYADDAAYAAYAGQPNSLNVTLSWLNGTDYGWRTIYGLGIVNGTRHLSLDQQFVDWFLSGAVQSQLPTNEWEYPANDTVPVPGVYDYNVDPASVVPLNPYLPPSVIASSLPGWLDAWQTIANQAG
ncbi:MAG: thiamine ABC transporter substrate-binding protein [Thermoplasmata archaeon]|nr:thiamine ABC transporter substrate-binding protein [Thermoplasmata archaeon]